jgi:hypothetical protein
MIPMLSGDYLPRRAGEAWEPSNKVMLPPPKLSLVALHYFSLLLSSSSIFLASLSSCSLLSTQILNHMFYVKLNKPEIDSIVYFCSGRSGSALLQYRLLPKRRI